jgi:hypothetical protein
MAGEERRKDEAAFLFELSHVTFAQANCGEFADWGVTSEK